MSRKIYTAEERVKHSRMMRRYWECKRKGVPFQHGAEKERLDDVRDHSLIAWVGEDELGSGRTGIKQALVPAGCVPLAAMDYHRDRLDKVKAAMEAQARQYGNKIRLVRFQFAEVLDETESGQ